MNDRERDPVEWRTSSKSGGTNCVEVALLSDVVLVRDSKARSGPILRFSSREWDAFVTGIRHGKLAWLE